MEMFFFNADNSPLNDKYTYGVLAHEFQHAGHFGRDRNETSWLNEASPELAVLLNGYSTGFKDSPYINPPRPAIDRLGRRRGAERALLRRKFSVCHVFLERFGEQVLPDALVREADNGMDSVDRVLAAIGIPTRAPVSRCADDLFMDWAVTSAARPGAGEYARFACARFCTLPGAAQQQKTLRRIPAALAPA